MDSKAIYKLMIKKCPNTKRNKHYLKRYVRFITACLEKNKDLPEDVYTEKHHILPGAKHFWPEYKNFRNYPWNKATLTCRQHVICHWILAKALEGHMWTALWCFIAGFNSGYRNGKIKSSLIDTGFVSKVREEYSKVCSQRQTDFWTDEKRLERSIKYSGKNNPFYGKKLTEEAKRKIGDKNRGENNYWYDKKRPEHGKKVSKALKDTPKSEEHKIAISKTHNVIYTCPHCGTKGGRLLLRWHFDNCFVVNSNKSIYKAICPSGVSYIFGYIGPFSEKYHLSSKVIKNKIDHKDLSPYELNKHSTITTEKTLNTVGWTFIDVTEEYRSDGYSSDGTI